MREYFKAFKDQNPSHREYRPYFKPVLSYLEGAWTIASDTLDEPFESDRHFLDAANFKDLLEKVSFNAYTGTKSTQENYAYLPSKIMENRNNTPVLAQWNYRIMVHPIQGDLPLDRLRVVDDLPARLARHLSINEYADTRLARFQLNQHNSSVWASDMSFYGFLDDIMFQVPGVDNYPADIKEDEVLKFDTDSTRRLNTGYYHRAFKVTGKDAMGVNTQRRGYNDANLFMAQTTSERIAPMSMESCRGRGRRRVCNKITHRWTYAIPLEIIYLTPLSSWNPYNFEYKGEANSDSGKTVSANGRTGGQDDKAFDGINSKLYYMTPASFFDGGSIGRDPADTTRGSVWVKTRRGRTYQTKASGVRIFFPIIPGVGEIRQRYPIFSVHEEGSSVWKELEALKEIVLGGTDAYSHMYYGEQGGSNQSQEQGLRLKLGFSRGTDRHIHEVELTADEVTQLHAAPGNIVTKDTSLDNGHSHTIEIVYGRGRDVYYMKTCSGQWMCPDGHPRNLQINTD